MRLKSEEDRIPRALRARCRTVQSGTPVSRLRSTSTALVTTDQEMECAHRVVATGRHVAACGFRNDVTRE